MTAVLCNKCSPFPPSSCSVRRRRAAVARHPSPPALSSRPPVRPAGNAVLPEIIVQFPLIHDTDLPHSTPKSSVASTGPSPSPGLYTKNTFSTTLYLAGGAHSLLFISCPRRTFNISNVQRTDHAANYLIYFSHPPTSSNTGRSSIIFVDCQQPQ